MQVTVSTYSGESSVPLPHHVPNPDYKAPTTVINPVLATKSIRSDVNRAHATANAVAKVVGSTVTKSASGLAWADATPAPLYDPRSYSFSATATGTTYVARYVSGDGSTPGNPATVPFSIVFPAFDTPGLDLGFPNDGTFQTAFGPTTQLPSQGIVRENGGIGFSQLSSMSAALQNPVLHIKVSLTQQGSTQTFFDGTAMFNNDVNQSVTFTGSFLDAASNPIVTVAHSTDAAGALRTSLSSLPQIDIVNIKPNVEFDLTTDVQFSLGDPTLDTTTQPSFDFAAAGQTSNFGVAAGFIINPTMTDPGHFNLTVVPEPASVVLMALGIAAWLACSVDEERSGCRCRYRSNRKLRNYMERMPSSIRWLGVHFPPVLRSFFCTPSV
ncbi:MAG TPA: hypothetical protein VGJ15_00900 [Pirellulales bacterium]